MVKCLLSTQWAASNSKYECMISPKQGKNEQTNLFWYPKQPVWLSISELKYLCTWCALHFRLAIILLGMAMRMQKGLLGGIYHSNLSILLNTRENTPCTGHQVLSALCTARRAKAQSPHSSWDNSSLILFSESYRNIYSSRSLISRVAGFLEKHFSIHSLPWKERNLHIVSFSVIYCSYNNNPALFGFFLSKENFTERQPCRF